MAAPLLLSIHDAYITFGGKPLFEDLSFNIHQGSKICLVGKNGAGKTTLMHMIEGKRELDSGKRWQEPGTTIGYLRQDAKPSSSQQTVFEYIFSGLEQDKQTSDYHYMVTMVAEPFELPLTNNITTLSGGQMRRAALARALVEDPDMLLLDEPTNHLDLGAIEWLENYLASYRGTLLCVSHDKTFLTNISDKVFWLDRGKIRVCPKGFGYFDEWSQMLLEQEERELNNRARIVAQEEEWASRGVKARRKRNVRRLEEMKKARAALKADKSLFNQTMRKIDLEPVSASMSAKIVAEFYRVGKTFENNNHRVPILERFNLRIMRGDRIGILGKNGSGKTTFLKLLLGELKPDHGKVKLAKNIDLAYFDQRRRDLNPQHSLWKTLCPTGGDYVEVGNKTRHVCGYLKDFLFDPKNAKDLVGTLSGGQQNRLLLAKVLANPGNFLILDEPTNDLDMDTLDMLEEILSHYTGTLFVVSHDRDFLDQTVTKILAFEGDAKVEGYIGGYSDYLEATQKGGKPITKTQKKPTTTPTLHNKKKPPASHQLSNKQRYELKQLPTTIKTLEKDIAALNTQLSDPSFYTQDPDGFDTASRRLLRKKQQLDDAETRWLELEELSSQS